MGIETVPFCAETAEFKTCGICFDELIDGQPIAKLTCLHSFCEDCTNSQIRVEGMDAKCGCCRVEFVHYKFTPVYVIEE